MSTDTIAVPNADDTASLSRRSFLRAATGIAALGAALATAPVLGQSPSAADAIGTIVTVGRTAEQLAVTFYTNGVLNAGPLGFVGADLDDIKAALIEEQIHQLFFTAQGGKSLADTFSFPDGAKTFTDRATFIKTQQQLEGAFDAAFIAAVKEFASPPIEIPALSQVATQIAMVESEHRALGRKIGGLFPADNWAFAPALLNKVGDAPGVLQAAGYLSPSGANSYKYSQIDFNDPLYKDVYRAILFLTPPIGDVNGDGKLDIKDATLALQGDMKLTTLTPQQAAEADVNGDGMLDVADVVSILRKIVGL